MVATGTKKLDQFVLGLKLTIFLNFSDISKSNNSSLLILENQSLIYILKKERNLFTVFI